MISSLIGRVRRATPQTFSVLALSALVLGVGACGPSGSGPDGFAPAIVRLDDKVVAEVDGSPIYVSDVRREAVAQDIIQPTEPLDPSSALFSQLLEELIDQRLLALESVRRDLNETQEARRRLANARERILGNILVETVVDSAVTEDAVRRMYEEQVKLVELGDEVRARHIIVDTFEEAEEVVRLINQGADFDQLAFQRSKDGDTRHEGGDLGYFSPETVIAPISIAAFSTEVGALSAPFKTEFGWHVLRVDDRREEERPTFDEMRPRIVRFMTFDEIQRLIDVLRTRADVEIYENVLTPAGSGAPAPPAAADEGR